jgi:hypothetical protein
MKLLKGKKINNYLVRILATIIVVIIISCSMTIDSVVQPMSINGGQTLPVTLNVTITTNTSQTSKLMIAVLAPKVWHVGANTHMTFTSDITTGPQSMTVIPAGTPAPQGNGLDWPTLLATKIGNGGNLINDWEWVAFYSDQDYGIGGNVTVHATVSISIPVSNDNLSFKLGYLVANSSDGLSSNDRYGSFFPGCFSVNGTGDLIDFCNPQLASIDPRTSLDNDIITLNFDSDVAANQLQNASEVYLCASGITTTGQKIDVCAATPASKMTSLGVGRWRTDIWPRKFFSLADDQHLARIEYFFMNASGSIKVGYGGGSEPFLYTFKCQ